jgi:hypothetical protein
MFLLGAMFPGAIQFGTAPAIRPCVICLFVSGGPVARWRGLVARWWLVEIFGHKTFRASDKGILCWIAEFVACLEYF